MAANANRGSGGPTFNGTNNGLKTPSKEDWDRDNILQYNIIYEDLKRISKMYPIIHPITNVRYPGDFLMETDSALRHGIASYPANERPRFHVVLTTHSEATIK